MKTGTCYFPSYGAAMRYYRPYNDLEHPTCVPSRARTASLRRLVDRKLNAGEIHIGKPDLKPGQTLTIEGNRYHITEN